MQVKKEKKKRKEKELYLPELLRVETAPRALLVRMVHLGQLQEGEADFFAAGLGPHAQVGVVIRSGRFLHRGVSGSRAACVASVCLAVSLKFLDQGVGLGGRQSGIFCVVNSGLCLWRHGASKSIGPILEGNL